MTLISTLLAACPVLQDLSLTVSTSNFYGLGESAGKVNVIVLVPTLKTLYIQWPADDYYAKRVLDFSRPLFNVQSLKLCMEAAEIFCNPYKDGIPMFHNLSSLMFYGELWPSHWCAWNVVQLMLCQAPKLQILAFELTLGSQSDYYNFKYYCHLKEEFYVPECLSSHLTTCYYKGFSGHGLRWNLLDMS
ncbi:hypothetical protein SO802_001038 [Lithocarpus litseifolius]|uniref:Uncharacterized protein n=1 Tax=Lithocarpus litseifolius TaxID=425828 RepID=A0AAW2DUY5_9ROSI